MSRLTANLSQFRTNPLRTLLTLLGMVFGVGSVVAMVSIGEGAQERILSTIEAMGAANAHIKAVPVPEDKRSEVINDSAGLSLADVDAIERGIPQIQGVGWRRVVPVGATTLKAPLSTTTVLAVSSALSQLHGLEIARGRALLPLDHQRGRRVAILGHKTALAAFPKGAIGQQFRLDYTWFEVVGVMAPRATTGGDLPIDPAIYDRAVVVPYTTAIEELEPPPAYGALDLITVGTAGTAATLTIKRALGPLFRQLHRGVEDYELIAPEEILRQRQSARGVLNIVLVCIAAISLLVGGIGVMNIMLANIMERIGEIGLRRAVGARRSDIRNQFLVEAVIICVVGGLLGILLGYTISFSVSFFVDLPIAFAWVSMVLAFGLSTLIGVLFGYVPAVRAANINPIEALHSE